MRDGVNPGTPAGVFTPATAVFAPRAGPRAGASSAYGLYGATADSEKKEVYFTRPFVYMLIDCKTDLPFFIGVLDDPTK